MRQLLTIFAFVFSLGLSSTAAHSEWTDWLTSSEYQQEFNWRAANGWYPRKVNATADGGEILYRADFIRTPAGRFVFAAHHGISNRHFNAYKAEYGSRGYKLIWHARIGYDGRYYNQGVWVRR